MKESSSLDWVAFCKEAPKDLVSVRLQSENQSVGVLYCLNLFVYVRVYVWVCAHACRCPQRPEVWDPPGAGATEFGRQQMWVLGIELQSSGRASGVLNVRASSLVCETELITDVSSPVGPLLGAEAV